MTQLMVGLPVTVAANPLCLRGVALSVVAAGNDGIELIADSTDNIVHILVTTFSSTATNPLPPGFASPSPLRHLSGILVHHVAVVDGLAQGSLPCDLDDVVRGGARYNPGISHWESGLSSKLAWFRLASTTIKFVETQITTNCVQQLPYYRVAGHVDLDRVHTWFV